MGDFAEAVVSGSYCMQCGQFIGPDCGYPRLCRSCGGGDQDYQPGRWRRRKPKHGGTPKLTKEQRTERNRRKRQRRRERERQRKNEAAQPAAAKETHEN